ncbi:uncharacterized protein LOC119551376 [Drosophila subpulchrella]|uniref:uncharacterized protein LOC119551376 n=1 Tax=Drosophila subpulchrella TaxID=1486046 RepID=UPI0018A14313|nr:uncharacterized protein LOC119551376 [Drosophila subpulchrella]
MNRMYLLFILALGVIDLSCGQECQKGFFMNPKRRKCELIPPTKPPPKCPTGLIWLPAKNECVRLRQIISGYYPLNHENATQSSTPCPTGTSLLGKICVKESAKKPGANGEGESESKYQVLIKEKP